MRSENFPYSGWDAVWVSIYATATHVYWSCEAPNSLTIVGRLVDKIVYIWQPNCVQKSEFIFGKTLVYTRNQLSPKRARARHYEIGLAVVSD